MFGLNLTYSHLRKTMLLLTLKVNLGIETLSSSQTCLNTGVSSFVCSSVCCSALKGPSDAAPAVSEAEESVFDQAGSCLWYF